MAVLEKLYLQGVRSFGPVESINFDSPFTLILGQNGCGKTTIIESLKYAITGVLPFGQGSSFVRDPKLDHSTESYGQVKVRFRNSKNKVMVIVRSLEARQKYKKLEVKKLDSTISVLQPDGSVNQLSGRCADTDEWLGVTFGVAKPILSYVIFCHQEDSFWPLDEGKKVKERFDEIFDSTKYNRCMVKITDLRKGVLKEIVEMKTAIQFLKENMDKANQKQKELEDKEKRFSDLQAQIDEFEKQIQTLEQENKNWRKKHDQFYDLNKKVDQLKFSLKTCLDHKENEEKEITLMYNGTQEELEKTIMDLDNQLIFKQKAKDSTTFKIQKVKEKEQAVSLKMSLIKKEIGSLESQLEHGRKLFKERNQKASQLGQLFGLAELDENCDEKDFSGLLSKIADARQKSLDEVDNLKQGNKRQQHELQLKINKCLEAKTKLESEIQIKKSLIADNEAQLQDANHKLQNADIQAKQKDLLDAKLDKARQTLEEASKVEDIQALTHDIKKMRQECYHLEERQLTLSEEVKSLNQQRSDQSKLAELDKKLASLQTNIRRARAKSEDSIKQLLHSSSDSKIKSDFEEMFDSIKKEIQLNSQQLSQKEKEVSLLDLERRQIKGEIEKKESELNNYKDAAYSLFGKRDYEDVLKQCNTDIESIQSKKSTYDSSLCIITGYIEKLRKTPCCPLCHRDFEGDQAEDLVSELTQKVESLPTLQSDFALKLEEVKQKHIKLVEFRPKQEIMIKLHSIDIPKLREKLEDVEEKLDAARDEVAIIQASLITPEEKRHKAEGMQSDIYDIDRYHKEWVIYTKERDTLRATLPTDAPCRSFEDAYAEQEELQKLVNQKRRNREAAEERHRKYNERVQELREEVNDLVSKQLAIEKDLQEREKLKERQSEFFSLRPVLQAELDELLARQGPAAEDKQAAERALRTAVVEQERVVRAAESKLQAKENELIIVKKLHKDYREFEDKQILSKLEKMKKESDATAVEQKDLVCQRDSMEETFKVLSSDIDGFENQKSQLKRNQSFMKYQKQAAQLDKELQRADAELGNIDINGIEAKLKKIFEKKDLLIKEKSASDGTQRELHLGILGVRNELESPSLKNADRKYKDKLIQLNVKKCAEMDLQAYFKALEYAMQHFHKDRMNAINKIVRELWRMIYRGNDIDHIEIKTDEISSPTATSGSDKRRSYNYRVVQVKNGIELDMRGRCSAGQKVLACIIIRIALAEMFSANCGILTLDEPTTNLDKQNICSLTDALIGIVRDHFGKKNFQLIVITHDHDFLQRISQADFFTHYWEVSRNHQSESRIVKKELDE